MKPSEYGARVEAMEMQEAGMIPPRFDETEQSRAFLCNWMGLDELN